MTDIDLLPDDLVELKRLLIAEREVSAKQAVRLTYLEEQFRLAQQKQFGASSESHPGQGELFNEAEEVVEQDEPPLAPHLNGKILATHATNLNVSRYPKTYPEKWWCRYS